MARGSQRCSDAASALGDLYVYSGLRRMDDARKAVPGVREIAGSGDVALGCLELISGIGTVMGYRDPATVVVKGSKSTSIADVTATGVCLRTSSICGCCSESGQRT